MHTETLSSHFPSILVPTQLWLVFTTLALWCALVLQKHKVSTVAIFSLFLKWDVTEDNVNIPLCEFPGKWLTVIKKYLPNTKNSHVIHQKAVFEELCISLARNHCDISGLERLLYNWPCLCNSSLSHFETFFLWYSSTKTLYAFYVPLCR